MCKKDFGTDSLGFFHFLFLSFCGYGISKMGKLFFGLIPKVQLLLLVCHIPKRMPSKGGDLLVTITGKL